MSGRIFSPLENLCDLGNANCHPLVCLLCQEQYEHPCLLDCYQLSTGLLHRQPLDLSSLWTLDVPWRNKQLIKCHEETHKARMFSCHEIVSLTKRTKDVHKKCPLHEELYIMFSTEKKTMLCINCFRHMPVNDLIVRCHEVIDESKHLTKAKLTGSLLGAGAVKGTQRACG